MVESSGKKVVVTDRRTIVDGYSSGTPSYDGPDPYRKAVEEIGAEVVFGDYDTEDEVIDGCRDADVVVTFNAPMTRRIIENLQEADLILRSGVGVDHVDVQAATEHGIPVSNVPGGIEGDAVATHAAALIFAAAHDIAYCDREMRAANSWGDRLPLNYLSGGTVGIIGLGYIGRAVVPKVRGFDMNVIAYDPYVATDVFEELNIEHAPLGDVLERSDAVTVHTPLNTETRHLLSTEEFKRMKETAVVVNTARGSIIDVPALVKAVDEREIYSAGLDVFETEPPVDSPALTAERIICSPHHSGLTPEAEMDLYDRGGEEIRRVLKGEHPRFMVNPEVYQENNLVDPEKGRFDFSDSADHP
jgi:D-3-phosphoglycerate dehydrogenase